MKTQKDNQSREREDYWIVDFDHEKDIEERLGHHGGEINLNGGETV